MQSPVIRKGLAMKVIRAEVLGLCFGVRDALKAIDAIDEPGSVTIHGELVHNAAVLERLRERGFQQVDENRRHALPMTPAVLITAHGVSDTERRWLRAAGKQLVDTTCPLVERVHDAALSLQAQGFHILLIGKRGHVEVQGVVEDLHSVDVIESRQEVRRYPFERLGIVCQTTATSRNVAEIRRAVEAMNPHAEIRFVDTVCLPTKEHQRALERLIEQADVMVVVGGHNSNNTLELARRCREEGLPTFHVQHADELRGEWFRGDEVVGLTAGTSTLDESIDEVHDALSRMHEPHVSHPRLRRCMAINQ
jgi:4-hydroxy-3-methylbut-2-enyl diphosphate reductase